MALIQTSTSARRKFGGYKPEKPKVIRTANVRKDPEVEKAMRMYGDLEVNMKKWFKRWDKIGGRNAREGFGRYILDPVIVEWVKRKHQRYGFVPNKELIEKLPFVLEGKGNEWRFLSSLIRASPDDNFVLHGVVGQRGDVAHGAGYMNNKNIIITNGGAIHTLGRNMEAGSITSEGDMRTGVIGSKMTGGRITVKGSILGNTNIGAEMAGGTIEIFGDCCGAKIGPLCGGNIIIHGDITSSAIIGIGEASELHVFGEIEDLSGRCHGKVFHKGKQIAP